MVPNGAGEVTVGKGAGVKVGMGVKIGEESTLAGCVEIGVLLAVGAQALSTTENRQRVKK